MFHLWIKRIFDFLFSVVAVILLLPLWIGVAVAIKKDSKGPVFFRQKRRTKDGAIFSILKFRTMVVGAEHKGTGLFNYQGDPRVTRVGRKLRDSSIDELPQLFQVITGNMSLVGPRPCVIDELGNFDTLNKKYRKRFEVKAGLTGLAQIRGRNEICWEEKVLYDNQYVDLLKKYGIFVDLWILAITVFKVLKKQDIYEEKTVDAMDEIAAAKCAEEEIIRLAHLPEEESND